MPEQDLGQLNGRPRHRSAISDCHLGVMQELNTKRQLDDPVERALRPSRAHFGLCRRLDRTEAKHVLLEVAQVGVWGQQHGQIALATYIVQAHLPTTRAASKGTLPAHHILAACAAHQIGVVIEHGPQLELAPDLLVLRYRAVLAHVRELGGESFFSRAATDGEGWLRYTDH